jgi:hypothetical protein
MQRPAPKKKMDALVLLAKASSGRRRRQSLVAGLVCVALILVLGVLMVWWIWPAPRPPRLDMAVFDQLALPGETVQLYAQLEPVAPPDQQFNMAGYLVAFEEPTSGLRMTTQTARGGVAICSGAFALSRDPLELRAGFPGNARERGVQGRGRIFVWPAETAFLLVDADRTLTALDPEAFGTVNNHDVRALPDAAPTLRGLAAKYAIVYVTGNARRPQLYSKLRAWLGSGFAPAQQFPDGPVLTAWGEPDAAAARAAVLTAVRGRLTGTGIGIAGDAETAAQYRQQGWETFLVGAAENVPEGITPVKDWAALGKLLPR